MSMAQPFQPNLNPDRDGVPAADLGAGAPEPAPGFGIGGEEDGVPTEAAEGTDDSSSLEEPPD
ncbi:hypothetical protein V2J56_00975 [Georgenia sp. MJ206]|uniref:hypothetical protein n=2 Tax=Georgenia wangjunii TaxID=3117730 RepID=UPI002F265635